MYLSFECLLPHKLLSNLVKYTLTIYERDKKFLKKEVERHC